MSALTWCEQAFGDYQFGLKLIEKNTGRSSFQLPVRAVEDSEGFLSDLVLESYRNAESSGSSSPAPTPKPKSPDQSG